jgi:hypothetical protein
VAEAAFAVQIETKKIRQLRVSHQQFTEAKRQNVGTLLDWHNCLPPIFMPHSDKRASWSLLVQDNTQEGFVDVDLTVVLDEAQFPEFVHEKIDPRASSL